MNARRESDHAVGVDDVLNDSRILRYTDDPITPGLQKITFFSESA